tara:strand:- start:46358 stop:48286 length:1929 start_codon:yes stop_codon:yes gene_type:complete
MHKQILSAVLILVSGLVSGQSIDDIKSYQNKYPGAQMVVLENTEELVIELNKGELEIYETYYAKKLYLTKDAPMFREKQLSFGSFSAYEDMIASTSVPAGTKYKKIKTKEFTTSDDMESNVFHDDSKIISFSFKGLQKGSFSELSYKRIIKDPHFIGRAILQDGFPVEHQVYRIIVGKGVDVLFTEYQIERDFISFSKTEDKGKTIYEWTVTDAPIIQTEKWSPQITYYTPQVLPRIASYQKNGATEYVLRDVNDLFSWYETFLDSVNTDVDNPMIKAIVDSVLTGSTDELDQVKRIFEWTQENIKYVAYEAGLGGFIPRSASTVCQNRYGDCKDMSSTITQLLSYAGIKAHYTWIGTNAIPFTYKELPTPSVDNHMIATYIAKDGQHYFMDATGRYGEFGLPSSFIQNQEALIRLAPGKFELYTVPVVAPEVNSIVDSVQATLTNGLFTAKAVSLMGGYYKQNLQYEIEDLSDDEKAKFYKAYLRKGNNKFLPENFEESNHYPSPKPFRIAYDFTIGDYAMENNDELYINLNLTDYFSGDKLKKDRKTPFEFKFIAQYHNVIEFTVPEGYAIDFVPEPIQISNELMRYESAYTINGNVITYTSKSNKTKLYYNVAEVALWNKSVNQINKSQKNVIILKKSN